MHTEAELIDAIESSFFLLADIPGRAQPLAMPGIRGIHTPISHPFANLVTTDRLTSSRADGAIADVHRFFSKDDKGFSWVVGPNSTPKDLPQRLIRKGLAKAEEMAGMALTDLSVHLPRNPDLQIRCATPEAMARHTGMIARAYGMPEELARHVTDVWLNAPPGIRTVMYFAYVEGEEEPVGFGELLYVPGTSIVLLGGAATRNEHRGKGVYSSLVARRLADARADGVDAAVVQAVRDTSAPICAKLGFSEICSLDLYAWTPPDGNPVPEA